MRQERWLNDPKIKLAFNHLLSLPEKDQKEMDQLAKESNEDILTDSLKLRKFIMDQVSRCKKRTKLKLPTNPNYYRMINPQFLRICWINQTILAGAIELYLLDLNKNTINFTPEFILMLVEKGYLKKNLVDPGFLKDSFHHYKRTFKGDTYCTQHGFLIPPKGCDGNSTIRDQLKAYGITDIDLLDECADIPPVPLD